MLTQVRRWGWLFNPITIFFVWDQADGSPTVATRPVGAVLEVTNTPWKERTRYPVTLESADGALTAAFDKTLHVSPFLTLGHTYQLRVEDRDDVVAVDLDVVDNTDLTVLHTRLRLDRRPATRRLLGASFRSHPFPTHRVSAGIHAQALRLRAKGVAFVPHPRRSSATPVTSSTKEAS